MPYTDDDHDRALTRLAENMGVGVDKSKISKGVVSHGDATTGGYNSRGKFEVRVDNQIVCWVRGGRVTSGANRAFIADAFNTFTATGLTPSELAEHLLDLVAIHDGTQVDEPVHSVQDVFDHVEKIKSALAKANPPQETE